MIPEIAARRSAREVLTWSRELVEPALRAAVDTLPTSTRRVAGYHLGWWDEHGGQAPTAATGKAIRPALVLLSAAAVGGYPREAVPAGVAVELAHNSSLLHDDVIDGDLTRRHRATVWSLFGIGTAILTGDALLTLALDVPGATGHPAAGQAMRWLGAAMQELLAGQSADLDFEQRTLVEMDECVGMAAAKTGALMGCACALGALFGGGRPDQVKHLRSFGEHLGLAFQHVDDLLGIWGDPAVTGKPVHSDLRSRKKSLPVVAALTSRTEPGNELAALYRRTTPLSDTELAQAASLIEHAGGRAWSQHQADDLLAKAMRQLAAGQTPSAELTGLARLVTRRNH